MGKSILVTGGARSGKSALAEELTLREGAGPVREGAGPVYIATCEAWDSEMAARIAEHRARRGPEWRTVEAPRDLVAALEASDGAGPRLVDCLTLWLTNLTLAGADAEEAGAALVAALGRQRAPVVLVTNEVGSGIVPESALGRAFRDAAGRLNQAVAAAADEVYLTVSGLPLRLKPR